MHPACLCVWQRNRVRKGLLVLSRQVTCLHHDTTSDGRPGAGLSHGAWWCDQALSGIYHNTVMWQQGGHTVAVPADARTIILRLESNAHLHSLLSSKNSQGMYGLMEQNEVVESDQRCRRCCRMFWRSSCSSSYQHAPEVGMQTTQPSCCWWLGYIPDISLCAFQGQGACFASKLPGILT
jgi:hypothetical protein